MLRSYLKVGNACKMRLYSQNAVPAIRPGVENVSGHYLKSKINDLVAWYEELTGMDEVREMQNRVIESQMRFAKAQEQRREANRELNKIQLKLKEITSELETTSRGETRYLQLVTQEHEILKEERRINAEFSLLEREERESFSLLSSYLKESHQKERAQAERTKYWSIIGSIVGTIIGVAGSSINNEFKMRELRSLVKETSLQTASLTQLPSSESLVHHEKEIASILSDIKSIVETEPFIVSQNNENFTKFEQNFTDFKSSSNQKVVEMSQNIDELKSLMKSVKTFDGQLVAIPENLEDIMRRQRNEIAALVVAASLTFLIFSLFRS